MVGNCPVCGAPWDGKVCEYCEHEAVMEPSKYAYTEPKQTPKYGYIQPQQSTNYGYAETLRSENESGGVLEMNRALQDADVSPKSRLVALLLCAFLGVFGGHRFYAGKIGTGVLYLLSYGLFGFGWIWDLVMIILGNFRDKQGLRLSRW